MTVKALIAQAARQFNRQPHQMQQVFSHRIFATGARWMFEQLPENGPKTNSGFDAATRFGLYGGLKYGLSLLAFAGALWALGKVSLLLTPLAVLVFYLVEVHFLFLFPLLLDRARNPLRTSIRETHRIGLARALIWVLAIGVFMLSGLLNRRQPLRRWHIGCLSVLLWYQHEVRNRIQPRL
ncbi:hypothetical protein MTP16_02940 [Hymenobacter monticola]|uniref:Uncharacterized protein n=1 Tax=Hymenobacter monticola TaxID=1705399 RepID=A0ABY4B666_9BACT|nr:hypothetical protein [Hymenobacter monticola]UOE34617.1 hypothetical protein MTP16_02940 [Hymenobacter monticola]